MANDLEYKFGIMSILLILYVCENLDCTLSRQRLKGRSSDGLHGSDGVDSDLSMDIHPRNWYRNCQGSWSKLEEESVHCKQFLYSTM